MNDCLIIGGGVIGLSLAYQLAKDGQSVVVLERGEPGREASWAGAGLLPPANPRTATDPYEQLAGLSHDLHPCWAAELQEETGTDTGYRRTGSIHVARDADSEAVLRLAAGEWTKRQIAVEELHPSDLSRLEPQMASTAQGAAIRAAFYLADEGQLRNPRHLKALAIACAGRGVRIEAGCGVRDFERRRGRIEGVLTPIGRYQAGAVCLCGGPWTGEIAQRLGAPLPTIPVRGQMVLLAQRNGYLRRIINEGRRYIVPRPDGRVLIGSTEEEVGFDKRTTADGVRGLMNFGLGLVPSLATATVEQAWAGLRPGTPDGFPYLGRIGGLENAFVAAGHLRGGLHLSTGTALVMSRLMRGEAPGIDLSIFSADRLGRTSDYSPSIA